MLQYDKENLLREYMDHDRAELRDELAVLQRELIDKDIPVIIMVDGFESSFRGYVINELVKNLDTKHYKVNVFDDFPKDENDYRYTVNFWKSLPAYGDISICYRSMYHDLFNDLKLKKSCLKKRIEFLKEQEKLLFDDNHIILKFFTDIDKKTQKKVLKEYKSDKYKEVLISRPDKDQQKNFDEYKEHIDKVLELSNFDFAKWNVIPADDKGLSAAMILSITIDEIRKQIKEIEARKAESEKFVFVTENKDTPMQDLDLTVHLTEDKYDLLKDKLQDGAGELAYQLYKHDIPTIIVFEGIDAAGKGGAIQRLVNEIDPRIYEINPTSAPTDAELDHHYLWRFYNNMPEPGRMAIFDRSWYGRVLVERIEKFANDYDWSRAYNEINTMEKRFVEQGALLLKYNLVISKDQQKERFEDREEEKPYKITDEDWRNREKWDKYIVAMNDMIHYTSTDEAPWKLIASEDKKHARIEVLKHFISSAEKILEERDSKKKKK